MKSEAGDPGKEYHANSASHNEENYQPSEGGDNVDGYQAMNIIESENEDDDSEFHTKFKDFFVYRVRRKSQVRV